MASASQLVASRPKLCRLPREAAQELVLLAVLAPLASSELSAPMVSTCVGSRLNRALWRTASKKGGYSRLFSKEEALLARFHDPEPFHFRALSVGASNPERPLAFFFDFLEVCGGSGRVARALEQKGRLVGPVIDIAHGPAFNLVWLRSLE